ncbi:putative serine threonine-protein phosphatase 2a activator 2 [Erysiphe necator]|uniref:Serine/threonine-protein phosphatase 2A activator n=1 Tax=Uncinula necator TaxID=52586 RepID=A0A0B1P091_UNCNE|nr:putative serine threonine-protein phosphatase 2a activator 2 [Erysiphe necator]
MSLNPDPLPIRDQTNVAEGQNFRFQLPKLEPRKRQRYQNPLPIPETPQLKSPPDPASFCFKKPSKRILSPNDHNLFLESSTYKLLLAFVFRLSESVVDTPVSAISHTDMNVTLQKIIVILDQIQDLIERAPPVYQGDSRFGNEGFRDFLNLCAKEHESWHQQLGISSAAAIDEISTYILQSFGNYTRIDYGSGHELNFILWLLCLYQLGIILPTDFRALVLVVFTRYLRLMRLIQSTYYLEPAGSHGVWGLDDYQFLPFLFGSSQLLHHPFIRPLSIHQDLVLEEYSKDFIYLEQVSFINSVKNVEGLRWHSPMLDDISSAKSWAKVEAGMRRMFVAEVLKKLPVMQHFLFGSLIPAAESMAPEEDCENNNDKNEVDNRNTVPMADFSKHVHNTNSWGDCCGIKVPSSIAVAQELKKGYNSGSQRLRRIPFD